MELRRIAMYYFAALMCRLIAARVVCWSQVSSGGTAYLDMYLLSRNTSDWRTIHRRASQWKAFVEPSTHLRLDGRVKSHTEPQYRERMKWLDEYV